MGEIADMMFDQMMDQMLDGEDQYEYGHIGRGGMVSTYCRTCKAPIKIIETSAGWKPFDYRGGRHNCNTKNMNTEGFDDVV